MSLDPTSPFDRAEPDRFEHERQQLRHAAAAVIEDYLEWGKPPATVRQLVLDSLRDAFTDEPAADPEGCSEGFRGRFSARLGGQAVGWGSTQATSLEYPPLEASTKYRTSVINGK